MNNILKYEYRCTSNDCVDYEGLSFLDDKFEYYLKVKVKDKFEDAEWSTMLTNEAVSLTGFSEENFVGIFENREVANSWRIGELVAESILEDKYDVRFYYNSSRDAKNLRSNLTGADLIGFCDIDDEICFMFGEVKTSEDEDVPPNVLYGKTGMIHQLGSLRDNTFKRDDLVKWIFGKSVLTKGEFREECGKALKTYIKSGKNKIQLIGVLVRDTKPTERDLKARARSLNQNIPYYMKIKLFSFYAGIKMANNSWEIAMNRGA